MPASLILPRVSFPRFPKFKLYNQNLVNLTDRSLSISKIEDSEAVENLSLYDVTIIGAGPAGCAAAIYCARKLMKTLLITESFGGQSLVSNDIRNWIGDKHISGYSLASKLEEHVRDYPEEITIKFPERVIKVETVPSGQNKRFCDFQIQTDQKNSFLSKSVIVCSGAKRRKLNVKGEDIFQGRGVAYCSVCDAPLFKDKKVVVIGGGNAGWEAVSDLLKYAAIVYIVDNSSQIRADKILVDHLKSHPKLQEIILDTSVDSIIGDKFVKAIKLINSISNLERVLDIDGVFIEVGSEPNSEIINNLVQLDEHRQVMVNPVHSRTSHPGIFAAGDITSDPYKQNAIAIGDGVRAALASYAYLTNWEKISPATESLI